MVITDIIVILLTAISCLLGLSRGFIKELLSSSKWLLSAYFAFIFLGKTKIFLSKFLKDSAIIDLIAGGLIFILSFFLLSIIFNFLSKILRTGDLGILDKTLGLLFGFARIVIVLSLALIIYNYIFFNHAKPVWITDSVSIKYIEKVNKYFENKFLDINLKNDIIT